MAAERDDLAALNAYMDHLKHLGRSNHELSKCKHFLRYLLNSLKDQPQTGDSYREAAEGTLRSFPKEEIFFEAVREFYYYWSGVERPEATERPVSKPREESRLGVKLTELLLAVDSDDWFKPDLARLERQYGQIKALHDYAEQLRLRNVDELTIQARISVLKPLLYILRDGEMTPDAYRMAVDGFLLMLPSTDRWHVFVSLAREFYYFWAHLPDAAQHLQLGIRMLDLKELFSS